MTRRRAPQRRCCGMVRNHQCSLDAGKRLAGNAKLDSSGLEELSHAAEFFVTAIEEFGDREPQKIAKRVVKDATQECRGRFRIGMRAAFRLGNSFVDNAES